jgi:hypothetical protein
LAVARGTFAITVEQSVIVPESTDGAVALIQVAPAAGQFITVHPQRGQIDDNQPGFREAELLRHLQPHSQALVVEPVGAEYELASQLRQLGVAVVDTITWRSPRQTTLSQPAWLTVVFRPQTDQLLLRVGGTGAEVTVYPGFEQRQVAPAEQTAATEQYYQRRRYQGQLRLVAQANLLRTELEKDNQAALPVLLPELVATMRQSGLSAADLPTWWPQLANRYTMPAQPELVVA